MTRLATLAGVMTAALFATSNLGADEKPKRTAAIQDFAFLDDPPPLLIRLHVEIDGQPFQQRWDDCLTRIFKHLDKNGDGFLDAAEAALAPSPYLFFPPSTNFDRRIYGRDAELRVPNFAVLGKNYKVSRDELAEYYRKNGGAPFQFVSDTVINDTRSYFGTIRVRSIDGKDPEPQATDVNDALFKLLDTNKDGKLSREELAAGAKILAKLDADEDEMIAAEEIFPTGRRANLNAVYYETLMHGPFNDNRVLLLSPNEPSLPVAQRLMSRYSSKKSGDNLLSFLAGKLTRKELGLDAAAFASLDINKDGFLDPNELKNFGKKTPDLELRLRLGKTPNLEQIAIKGTTALRQAGTSLTLDRGPSRVVFRLDSALLAADLKAHFKAEFQAYDQDGNGYLDRREARQSPFFHSLFNLMDKDKDGKLFEKEMLAYLDSWGDLPALARSSCVTMTLIEEGKGLFDLLDTNRDRRLGVHKIAELPKLLDQLDRNKDGFLDPTEFPRSTLLEFRQGPAGRDGMFSNLLLLDSFDGVMPLNAGLPQKGPLWFRKMDRNRDGDVSRAEFLGTDEEFRRIDADGDGLISLEEAERFDALMRKKK